MNRNLQQLYKIFYIDPSENESLNQDDLDIYRPILSDLNLIEDALTHPLKLILNQVYQTDDIECLKRLINTTESIKSEVHYGIDCDLSFALYEFTPDEEVEKNEHYQMYADEYGEAGQNVYHIYTKNYLHAFFSDAPFSNGIQFEYSQKLD